MEAKDTVTLACICKGGDFDNQSVVHSDRCLAFNEGKRKQAEISFKAGVEQGIKEVVEWIVSNSETFETHSGNILEFNLRKSEWQAQLRIWGIK